MGPTAISDDRIVAFLESRNRKLKMANVTSVENDQLKVNIFCLAQISACVNLIDGAARISFFYIFPTT